MNPYLEQDDAWHDFHDRFLPALADALASRVDSHYVVKIDEHVFIHEAPDEGRNVLGLADVLVATGRPATETQAAAPATIAAPAQIALPAPAVERLSYLEIRDRRDRKLVTIIELLSPSNKYSGTDREQYLHKRGQILASRTHLVEIDLLRGGPRMPFAGALPGCAYYVLVSRVEVRPQADLWPIRLRDPLPTIPVPLRDDDPDVRIDLQAVLHRVYEAAHYANYIYEGAPHPSLPAADAAWARQVAGLP
jgi:hypothetical protein